VATPPKRFHGTVKLDATRVGRDASSVADELPCVCYQAQAQCLEREKVCHSKSEWRPDKPCVYVGSTAHTPEEHCE
jgi:hypothetical protein